MREDWIECTLGDIAKIFNGNSINKRVKEEKYSNVDSGLNYIGTKDVQVDGKISYDTGVTIPFNEEKFKIAPKNCVLVCSEGGSAGKKTAFVEKEICFGNKLYAITNVYNSFDGKYIFYYTRYNKFFDLFRNQMNGIIGGVSQRKFNKIIIPLPPLVEQQAIVNKIEELFSSLDNGIADLKRAQDQLKIYRQAVLKKAFEGDYKLEKLGQVAEVKRGKSKHRPRNDKSLFGGKYPFIQTGEIRATNGGVIKEYTKTYSEKGLAQSKLWPKGTLCLTIAANIGETAFLGFDACFPDSVVGIKPNDELLNSKYLNFYVQKIKDEMDSKASATAQKNINVRILDALEIPLPSLKKQHQIVQEIESRLSVCDAVEQNIKDSLDKAQGLRQSILKKAFEGKLLTPQEITACKAHPNYEPASVLLEKIRKEKVKK